MSASNARKLLRFDHAAGASTLPPAGSADAIKRAGQVGSLGPPAAIWCGFQVEIPRVEDLRRRLTRAIAPNRQAQAAPAQAHKRGSKADTRVRTRCSVLHAAPQVESSEGFAGSNLRAPSPFPAHQTGRADFPASGFPTGFMARPTAESSLNPDPTELPQYRGLQRLGRRRTALRRGSKSLCVCAGSAAGARRA